MVARRMICANPARIGRMVLRLFPSRAEPVPGRLFDPAQPDRGRRGSSAVFGPGAGWIGRTGPGATDEVGAAVRSIVRRQGPSRKGTATMKLTTVTNVSVDGVMQGLGGPSEDRRGGFERGGWAPPLFDDEATTFLSAVYQRADAFLFGRRTYEIFARSWGTGSWGTDQGNNPISVAL